MSAARAVSRGQFSDLPGNVGGSADADGHPLKGTWYGAGFVTSAFWNYINLFVNTFIRNGVDQLIGLLQTGRIARPDQFLAVICSYGTFRLDRCVPDRIF
jgi:hypothetical protein